MDIIKNIEMENMVQEVLEDMLGPNAKEIDVIKNMTGDLIAKERAYGFFDPRGLSQKPRIQIPHGPLSYLPIPVRPEGVQGPLKPRSMMPLRSLDLDDVRYITAHEAGHAKDFFGRGKGNIDIFNRASSEEMERLADQHSMTYMKNRKYKLGEGMSGFATGEKKFSGKLKRSHFPAMAKRFGIIPLLMLSALSAVGIMGEE